MIDTRFPMSFGSYTLLDSLGRGGMAEVFLATFDAMPGVQRLVALKQVLPGLAEDPTFVAMFLDEARVLTNLYHPNIDQVLDVGEVDGVPFMALDYVPGRDLLQVLRRQEQEAALPPEIGVYVASRVCAGLSHAHTRTGADGRSLRIVHRDISPENIIVTFEGSVKLVDFGIARGEMRAVVTEPGFIKGKPSYMAPEQILAQDVDHRADVFAVGVLLYRLTVGRHPFRVTGDDERTFLRIVQESPAPPHLVRRDFPESLSLVILKAMDKEPARRYQSADALINDLEAVMREQRWLGSDRQLRKLMHHLFPEAARAAGLLVSRPTDAGAAREASYYAAEPSFDDIDTPVQLLRTKSRDARLEAADYDEDEVTEVTPTDTSTVPLDDELATLPGMLDVPPKSEPPRRPRRSPPPPPAGARPRDPDAPVDSRLRDVPWEDDRSQSEDIFSDVLTRTGINPPGHDEEVSTADGMVLDDDTRADAVSPHAEQWHEDAARAPRPSPRHAPSLARPEPFGDRVPAKWVFLSGVAVVVVVLGITLAFCG